MITFILTNWGKILVSLLTAGSLGVCGYCLNQFKKIKNLIEKEKAEELQEKFEEMLAPIVAEIEELRTYIRKTEEQEKKDITLIVSSYRYRLVQLCKLYIKQGFITSDQYEQISEFYKLYRALGGNGQAKDFWERVQKLPIHE